METTGTIEFKSFVIEIQFIKESYEIALFLFLTETLSNIFVVISCTEILIVFQINIVINIEQFYPLKVLRDMTVFNEGFVQHRVDLVFGKFLADNPIFSN